MGHMVRKPDFCLCENKGTDQFRSNCEADQHLCFCYTDSTNPLLFESLVTFCACTGRFVSDLVVNPEDRFFHVAAQYVTVITSVLKSGDIKIKLQQEI